MEILNWKWIIIGIVVVLLLVVFVIVLRMARLRQEQFEETGKHPEGHYLGLGIGIGLPLGIAIMLPVGIAMARSDALEAMIRPLLDLMQTMPPFVYLIPAAIFFGLGTVPGAIATLIFSMPPAVRLTNLGIRQVSREQVEAGQAFGCTDRQLLFRVQLPLAMPSIMAGVNQTIMLALSMVVIASMIGAGGLGNTVLTGIQRLNVGLGFEGGLGVVLLAILLDRITQSFGRSKRIARQGEPRSLIDRLRRSLNLGKTSMPE